MNPYNVLVRPLLSEKSNRSRENDNKYSFQVRLDSSKDDIRKAVEKVFEVKVTSVRTAITRGKIKRRGNTSSKLSNTKKAVVSLAEGTKINLFADL